jgi:hypothetical protein
MKPEDHKSPGFLIFCPYHLEVQFGAVEKVHFLIFETTSWGEVIIFPQATAFLLPAIQRFSPCLQ